MKKRDRPTDGGGNWMDTYGDMVTLLLTFFIMLYAMSNVDQQKWEIFVKSINPSSGEQQEVAINTPITEENSEVTGSMDINGDIPEEIDIEKLYLTLGQKMNEIGIEGVTISRGKDYTYISFRDKTFFDGDSSVLTQQGKATLDVFCEAVAPAGSALSQINIMGHTSQGDPDRPNNPRTDRMLSAMRGAEVCIYLQGKQVVEPEKLVSISYGQFRPIAPSDTHEGRAKNRRVEIIMIDSGADVDSLNKYYEDYESGVNADKTIVTDGRSSVGRQGFESVEAAPEDMAETTASLNTDGNQIPTTETTIPSIEDGNGPTAETLYE